MIKTLLRVSAIEKSKKLYKFLLQKLKNLFLEEDGGNLVEYALLIGFALFIFFIIVGVITSILNWTIGLSNDFFDIIGGFGA